ncbi:cobalamin-binding protein [Parazoarcus communis]|uniref:Cobalamin-binding protein n=1 Tax=Parazoarcus communis SWub3 = DSM 12120 TaxID=1121029 RepID=A0A323VE64_9RHOO|nr:cobalamin-binding protein [Parazoarcus communis]NMG69382.1 ABC transporter substrate-binding protein [Parazoarcus communis SWub3 = DSM 12120]PZA18618.1 cobalamin-binding protein [Azoarcus communis] [Parazoarcus communis SWub3 = DSM 12120]
MTALLRTLAICLLLATQPIFAAEVSVRDDAGKEIRLKQPATRIVSLAPHITELLFAAGAGDRVVGVVSYSDYPEAATKLPQVGGYTNIDMEAIAALQPDLVVAWKSGNRNAHLDRLNTLGVPVYINEPRSLDDVARSLEALGHLAGSDQTATEAARAFRERLSGLRQRYTLQAPVRTFYQVWDRPLTTINGAHLIGDVIRLCGGENIFAELGQLAPNVSAEAVLAANPEAVVASGMGEARPEWLDQWRRWPELHATRADNLFFIPPAIIQRHTPRILDGASRLCELLEQARAKRTGAALR